MSTDNQHGGSSDSNDSPATADVSWVSDGFYFSTREERKHRIDEYYPTWHVDEYHYRNGQIEHCPDDSNGNERDEREIECKCGKTFDGLPRAKQHLIHASRNAPPIPACPNPLGEFSDEDTICDDIVPIAVDKLLRFGRVLDNHEYLIATARAVYTPPPAYDFSEWQPLVEDGGRLYVSQHEAPQFPPVQLKRALRTLAGATTEYRPERYRIYYRGKAPLYIEGPEHGVVIAQRSF